MEITTPDDKTRLTQIDAQLGRYFVELEEQFEFENQLLLKMQEYTNKIINNKNTDDTELKNELNILESTLKVNIYIQFHMFQCSRYK